MALHQMSNAMVVVLAIIHGTVVPAVTPHINLSSHSMVEEAEDSRSICSSSRECRSIKPMVLPTSSSVTKLPWEVLAVMLNRPRSKTASMAREAVITLTTFEVVVSNIEAR